MVTNIGKEKAFGSAAAAPKASGAALDCSS
jgi:hypothetical protein